MRNIDHSRIYHMFMVFIAIKRAQIIRKRFSGKLSIFLRKCDDLMSGIFYCSCLVSSDMAALRGNNSLIRIEHGADHALIRLSPACKKIDVCLRAVTGSPYFFLCRFTVWIHAISGKLFHVCLNKARENFFMCSFRIIIFKI